MKKIFVWKKFFICPSCGEKIVVHVWQTLPSKIFGPEKYACLNCKKNLVLPPAWLAASVITTFIATMLGIIVLFAHVPQTTYETTDFLQYFSIGIPAMWLGGVVALMAPHLVVHER